MVSRLHGCVSAEVVVSRFSPLAIPYDLRLGGHVRQAYLSFSCPIQSVRGVFSISGRNPNTPVSADKDSFCIGQTINVTLSAECTD